VAVFCGRGVEADIQGAFSTISLNDPESESETLKMK
jgi:hypothetical protein